MSIRIMFSTSSVDLLIGPDGLDARYTIEREQSRSGSGKIETIVQHAIIEGFFDARFTDAVYEQLIAWWSWASQGKAWSFTIDSSKMVSTMLDAAAAAGQKVVPITATAGLSADDWCLIRTADGLAYESVQIDTISAGVSITAKSNLAFTYAAGDAFRNIAYFPSVISLDKYFQPKKNGSTWKQKFHFIESV